jgi:hypothetical protein
MFLCHEWALDLLLVMTRRLQAGIQYRHYARQLLLLILLMYSFTPLFAERLQEPSRMVLSIVSGIVSYTTWPALAGQPRLCIFSSSRYTQILSGGNDVSLPYIPVVVNSESEALTAHCDGFYFGAEAPAFQKTLVERAQPHALLVIAEHDPGCMSGSAFCLLIQHDRVDFTTNLDVLSRSGVRVNPDVLMLARKNKDG